MPVHSITKQQIFMNLPGCVRHAIWNIVGLFWFPAYIQDFFLFVCLFCAFFNRKIPTTTLPMEHMDARLFPFAKKLCHNYLFRCRFDPKYHRVGSSKSMANYDFRQWETTLHCNAISHWLSPYQEWSLIHYGFCRDQNLDPEHSAARRLIIKSPDSKV